MLYAHLDLYVFLLGNILKQLNGSSYSPVRVEIDDSFLKAAFDYHLIIKQVVDEVKQKLSQVAYPFIVFARTFVVIS